MTESERSSNHAQNSSVQSLALIAGEPMTVWPKDLFIPPDALLVLLESFEGPLDLLYYLIKRQNLNILDIPIALVTRQYMEYIQVMAINRLELAADYLVMAAMLAEIKSGMLLPRLPLESQDETLEDPRQELIKKLQAYEQMKQAALALDALHRFERDLFAIKLFHAGSTMLQIRPEIELDALVLAMQRLITIKDCEQAHTISREIYSTRDRMKEILLYLENDSRAVFHHLFTQKEGKMGLVTTFIAILELARLSLIRIVQSEPFSTLYILLPVTEIFEEETN